MVDVKSGQSARFLATLPHETKAILFYGTDEGLIAERAERLAKALANDPKLPGEILRLADSEFSDDPGRLGVELRTVSMFSGRKIVRLGIDGRFRVETITTLLEGPLEGFLILESGNLKPDSKIRTFFAGAANAAAVACYPDDSQSLGSLIDQVASDAGMAISADARMHLAGLLGADRVLSRNEVEKLVLYASGKSEISIEDIDAVVADAGELTVDRVTEAAANGDAGTALRECDRAVASGEAVQTILLAMQRYVLRLHQIGTQIQAGKSFELATRMLRPPLHFKQRDSLAAQTRTWSPANISSALAATQRAIEATRLNPALERELAERLLMEIARLGRPRPSVGKR
mgnify:CR=1 FL=1